MCLDGLMAARSTEKHDAESLGETRGGQSADQPQRNERDQPGYRDVHRRLNQPEETRIEQQEFADETVEPRAGCGIRVGQKLRPRSRDCIGASHRLNNGCASKGYDGSPMATTPKRSSQNT